MFATLQDRLAATFKDLRGKGRLSDADIDATAREIRVALLEADVALPVVKDFVAAVKDRARGAEVSKALNPAQQIIKIVNEELVHILGGETRRVRWARTPPTVIMLCGLQGSGKTTLAGKLGRWLKTQGNTPLLVAADLQRPNAVTQLKVVGAQAGVPVWAPEPGNVGPDGMGAGDAPAYGGDPVAVARSGVEEAQRRLYDVVIVDTAGRLGVDRELMEQAADIRDAVRADETLFVLDAMIGQDAVNTALAFLDGVGFDVVVLTKLDGDARGGAALSVAQVTGRQVMFASAGERLDDFDVFHPERMASRILGMGDVLTLIEQAERAFDADQAAQMADKLQRGSDFTLEDFLGQLQAVRKMGSFGKLLGMLPGAAQMREQIENFDEREVDRVEAIIRSMTPAEREDPRILNGSRRARIARGSGMAVSDVNGLVDRFFQARDMMSAMARGGAGGVPGMGGMPGMPGLGPGGLGKKSKGRQGSAKGSGRGKQRGARSGNPAKRAAELAALDQRRTSPVGPPAGDGVLPAAFGGPDAGSAPGSAPGSGDWASGEEGYELPVELRDLLGKQP